MPAVAHRAQMHLCFVIGYNPEELLKSRHIGKFGLTGSLRDDRDDIDDIFGGGIFIVLNVTIGTFAGVADTKNSFSVTAVRLKGNAVFFKLTAVSVHPAFQGFGAELLTTEGNKFVCKICI